MKHPLASWAAVVAALFVATGARAEVASAASPEVLALIVTNNRGAGLERPDLRYADDDGVKYRELFGTLGGDENVVLLTELDADTQRLFPQLQPAPPTTGQLQRAADRLAQRADRARRAGREVDFYFIFAGHGDIAGGRGFLSLQDGNLDGDGVEQLLRKVAATRAHVILDSCNSFFVLNPRKPGGRRFATPADAAEKLSRHLPNVGVFLSTSAEAEVFEWSELQAGIFSHAVRSGLAGAADSDGDGRVSYRELEAFVAVASAEIKNPLYRPSVFARGPGAHNDAAVVDWRGSRAVRLRLEGNQRVTVRDRDELPWIDVHTEPGSAVELRLPARLVDGLSLELRDETGRVTQRLGGAAATATLALADFHPLDPASASRGPQELFERLFTRPFGAHALEAYWSERAHEAPVVIGVARDDVARMGLLLSEAAGADRERRVVNATLGATASAAVIGSGIWQLIDDGRQPPSGRRDLTRIFDGVLIGVGAGGLVYSVLEGGLKRSDGEKLEARFLAAMRRAPADVGPLLNGLDAQLEGMRRRDRSRRITEGVLGAIVAGLSALSIGLNQRFDNQQGASAMGPSSTLLLIGAGAFAQSFFETPIERIARLWRQDPSIGQLPRASVRLDAGPSSVTLSGRF